jgi:hypothetical protein
MWRDEFLSAPAETPAAFAIVLVQYLAPAGAEA